MEQSRFTKEQIAYALRLAESDARHALKLDEKADS